MNNETDVQPQKRVKYELPTKDEQKQLQQMDLLMKSSLLQLELEQLLSEVSGQGVFAKSKVVQWVKAVTSFLTSSPAVTTLVGSTLTEKTIKTAGLTAMKILHMVNTMDDSMELVFQAPVAVDLIGSHTYKTATAPMLNIDIAVTMAGSMFDTKYVICHYCSMFLYAMF